MIGAAIVLAAIVAGIVGHARSRTIRRTLASRYSRDAAGIIVGAHDIKRSGSRGAAVLLIHGAGDTPQTLRHVADELHKRGYSVSAPLLPGHGRDLESFASVSADDWYSAVRDEYLDLRRKNSWVGVFGLSMGGALSARLAAENPDIPALVLASPYLTMPLIGRIAARTGWLWGILAPAVSTASDLSVLDPKARQVSLGYGAFTPRSLRALEITAMNGFAALSHIQAPTLMIQSTTDNRVSSAATRLAYDRLAAAEKTITWIEGAGHVITVDFGWQRVIALSADWMDSHRAGAQKGAMTAPF